jgi:hypothetical protein
LNTKELIAAMKQVQVWLEFEHDSLELFHAYSHRFGATPGTDVFMFVLKDALAHRGMTLEQLKAER